MLKTFAIAVKELDCNNINTWYRGIVDDVKKTTRTRWRSIL